MAAKKSQYVTTFPFARQHTSQDHEKGKGKANHVVAQLKGESLDRNATPLDQLAERGNSNDTQRFSKDTA